MEECAQRQRMDKTTLNAVSLIGCMCYTFLIVHLSYSVGKLFQEFGILYFGFLREKEKLIFSSNRNEIPRELEGCTSGFRGVQFYVSGCLDRVIHSSIFFQMKSIQALSIFASLLLQKRALDCAIAKPPSF